MDKLGCLILGSETPAEGLIRNLNLMQSGASSAAATYVHQGATEELHAAAYLDGALAAVSQANVMQIGGLGVGAHNINVAAQVEAMGLSTLYFDEEDGRRIVLAWQPVAGEISGYNIYAVDLAGDNPVLVKEIRRRRVAEANLMYPSAGTGMGRISVAPVPVPEGVNGALEIEITGAGAYAWTLGAESGSGTFARGTVITAAHNIKVLFADDAPEYVDGDTFALWAGPETRWTSDELAAGNYRYAITALSAYLEESDLALTQVLEIAELPAEVTVTPLWNAGAQTLTLEVSGPCRFYTNWLADEGELTDYVSLMPQWEADDGAPLVLDFTGVTGTLKFYARGYDAVTGRENTNFSLMEVAIPAEDHGVIMGTPENLRARRIGNMGWELDLNYLGPDNDAVTRLDVYRVTGGDPFTFDATDRVGTMPVNPLTHFYEFAMDDSARAPGPIDICVVAHAGDPTAGAVPGTVSEVVSVTLSAGVEPDAPGGLVGGAA